MKPIIFTLPLHLKSCANMSEHWAAKGRRVKEQRAYAMIAAKAFGAGRMDPPWHVTITRVAPRPLDSDNMQAAAKATRDGIADALGLRDDSDPRISWAYRQERGKPSAVRVEIR